MPLEAVAIVLAAAFLHALWNLLLASAPDTSAAIAVATAAGALITLPIAIARWRLEADALPWVAGSAALELAYFVLLARAYAHADLSLVYPVARGLSPVLVLVERAVPVLDADVVNDWLVVTPRVVVVAVSVVERL